MPFKHPFASLAFAFILSLLCHFIPKCTYFQYKKHEEKRFANIETFDEVDAIEPIGNEIDNNILVSNGEWEDNIAEPTEISYVNYPRTRYPLGIRYPQRSYFQPGYRQPSYYALSNYPQPSYPQSSYPQNTFSQASYPQMYNQAVYSQRYPPIDLSRDTYVNEILAQSGAPTNPDAEVFFDLNTSPGESNNRFRYPR